VKGKYKTNSSYNEFVSNEERKEMKGRSLK
jgi:hypothetical protein